MVIVIDELYSQACQNSIEDFQELHEAMDLQVALFEFQ